MSEPLAFILDWERIKMIGLTSKIKSPEDYLINAAKGVAQAERLLSKKREIVPSLATIRELHFALFKNIHPWAGDFRIEGQEVRAGELLCTLSTDIISELTELTNEMNLNPLTGTKKYRSELLAFYHAAFLEVHPFLDGNGRLSRVIAAHQSKELLSQALDFSKLEKSAYINSLRAAQSEGELKALITLFETHSINLSLNTKIKTNKQIRSLNHSKRL